MERRTRRAGISRYRIFTGAILLLTALFSISACQTAVQSPTQAKTEQSIQHLYVIGHRGAAGLAPENTISSFKRAIDIGVDAFELDVHLTVEGEPVVHHDFYLKPEIARKPDGSWISNESKLLIKDLTVKELKTYDVGRLKPGTEYSQRYPEQQSIDGEHIPTLREVISLLKSRSSDTPKLWVEIKTTPEEPDLSQEPETVAETVVKVLREEDFVSRSLILSFDWRTLLHVQKIAPEIPTLYVTVIGRRLDTIKPGKPGPSPWTAGLDIDDFEGSIPRAIKAAGGKNWAHHYRQITSKLVNEAHQMDIRVFAWTPDYKNEMKRLIRMNVDGIITNRPDILRSILSAK
jgi:glycerophosphoryl diester phosphodiesterase